MQSVEIHFKRVDLVPANALGAFAYLLRQWLGNSDENEEEVKDSDGGGKRHHEVLAVEAAQIRAERRTGDETGGERGRHEAVRGRAVALVRDVGHVGEHDRERDGEEARDGDHGEVPHRIDAHERYWQTGEEHGHEEEHFPAPDVRHGADQRSTQKWQQTLFVVDVFVK